MHTLHTIPYRPAMSAPLGCDAIPSRTRVHTRQQQTRDAANDAIHLHG